MQHFHPVAAICDIGEQAGVGRRNDDIFGIGQRAARRIAHQLTRAARAGDVDDHQPLILGGNIHPRPRDIHLLRRGQGDIPLRCCNWIGHVGDIEQLYALRIGNPQIAELDRARLGSGQRHHRCQSRIHRVVEIDRHQPAICRDEGIMPGQRDMLGTRQNAPLVPRHRAVKIVVAQLAIGKSIDVDEDQALFAVGDRRIIIDGVESLFLIDLAHHLCVAGRRDRLVGRQRHAGRIAATHPHVMPQRREWRGYDPLRIAFVGDLGDVIDGETAATLRHEHIFAAHLQTAHRIARALHDIGELFLAARLARQVTGNRRTTPPVDQLAPVALDMLAIIVGPGIAVQIAADHGLRLVPFGDARRLEPAFEARPIVQSDEIDPVGAKQQQLRHDRIIILILGQVAIRTGLGLLRPHGMREMRGEGLAGETDRADRRLLHIDALAVDVGR